MSRYISVTKELNISNNIYRTNKDTQAYITRVFGQVYITSTNTKQNQIFSYTTNEDS